MYLKTCTWWEGDYIQNWPRDDNSFSENHENALNLSRIRRRLTPLGQMVIEVMSKLAKQQDNFNTFSEIPWVVSTRHGDTERMIRLLSDLAKDEMLSPTDFALSVYNGIIGSYSILTKNKATHTAVASGEQSFEAGLIETYAQLKGSNGPVGYLYYDHPLPEPFCTKDSDQTKMCISMIFQNAPNKDESHSNIILRYHREQSVQTSTNKEHIDRLIHFIQQQKSSTNLPLNIGRFQFEKELSTHD